MQSTNKPQSDHSLLEPTQPSPALLERTQPHPAHQKQAQQDPVHLEPNLTQLKQAQPDTTTSRSYVVPLSLWEQLIGATRNYFHLQCWAKTLQPLFNVSVVEPYLRFNRSILGFPFWDKSDRFTNLTLSSLYNMSRWPQLWPRQGGDLAPIVSSDDMWRDIAQNEKVVIFVEGKYLQTKEKRCRFTLKRRKIDLKGYENLRVQRTVCINFNHQMSPHEFNQLVFGDLLNQSGRDFIVLFDEWRGIGGSRMFIKLPSCSYEPKRSVSHLSGRVMADAEAYAKTHLGGFGQYISVSARFEKISYDYYSVSQKKRRQDVETAISESMQKLRDLKKKSSVTKVYLAYDFGQFGSSTFKHSKFYNSSDLLTKFLYDVYDGKVTYSEYEQSFMALGFGNPGYIATVQMAISSRGKCLLRIGFGGSIDFVTTIFRSNHQSPFCIVCVPARVCKHFKKEG